MHYVRILASSTDASLTISHSTIASSSLMPRTPPENTVSTRDQEMNTAKIIHTAYSRNCQIYFY